MPEELKEFSFTDSKKKMLSKAESLSGSFTNESNSVASKLKQLDLSFSANPSLSGREDDSAETGNPSSCPFYTVC
ncbi:DUF5383 family protein [Bacillus licheniformis]|nr:DUF5383 family protein [Bacillus licheniformis]